MIGRQAATTTEIWPCALRAGTTRISTSLVLPSLWCCSQATPPGRYIEKAGLGRRLFAGAVGEAVNVFAREGRRAGASRKHWDAPIETDIRVRDPPEQRFNELVDTLSRLAREICEPLFQRGIHGDRGVPHTLIVPHIDETLLRDARSVSGAKTDTDTVRLGLEALVRQGAYERLRALRGRPIA